VNIETIEARSVSNGSHNTISENRNDGDALLGADVALSSEELLNVGARGVEDGGQVSGRHFDGSLSRRT